MQCDNCHKNIEEDDTYERILCYRCNKNEELLPKLHCSKCACILKYKNIIDKIKAFCKDHKLLLWNSLWVIILLIFVFLITFHMHVPIIYKFIAGLFTIAFVFGFIFVLWFFLAVFPYKFACSLFRIFDIDLFDISEVPGGIITWFIGLCILTSPYLLYLVGFFCLTYLKHINIIQ